MKQFLHKGIFKIIAVVTLVFAGTASWAQYKISGTVIDQKGRPVRGASVSLDGTIDGSTTDSMGIFRFTTDEKGNQSIVATEVSHKNSGMPIVITGDMSGIVLKMGNNSSHELDQVTITAGAFNASDDANKTVLRPLDIVTTAGANADVVKAIETLPGTQQTGADNGLFVRGGDASEAAILVDEMVVQNAFFSGAPGVATRSRFGAFQYQGVSFSSGGYSAKYGQALSSVLELNSTDLPDKSTVNLGVNMAGIYASATKKWKNSAIDVGGNYNNLTPFYGIASTNFKFYNVPVGGGGNARYVWKPNKNGLLKVAVNASYITSGVGVPNPYTNEPDSLLTGNPAAEHFKNEGDTINFKTRDQNYYSNISYKQSWKNKYTLYTAASYSLDQTNNFFGDIPINEKDQRAQYRLELNTYINRKLSVLVGGEIQNFSIEKTFANIDSFKQSFTETQIAGYIEADWNPFYWLAIRPGVRYEHSALLNNDNIAPRLSMAIRTGDYSNVSLATGIFYQDANSTYLLVGARPGFQEAIHYIANWQWTKSDRTLRVEGYYKNYASLIRDFPTYYDPNAYRYILPSDRIDNSGHGYAQGLELFWRDRKTFKNVDYWISYSYIDTKRLYDNFPVAASPTFIANHNLNLVGKYFVQKWNTNFSATYTFASGRPYYNPDPTKAFLSETTKPFNNFAVTISYLHSFGKWFSVFYLSIDNITNSHNIFGYRYTYDNDTHKQVPSPIVPALYRSIFFGVNFSLTQFKKDEL